MRRMKKITAGAETGFGAGVLIFAKDLPGFLWIKRSASCDEPGTWCIPGGGVEDYETIEEAVIRECNEEIGYTDLGKLLHLYRDRNGDFTYHSHLAIVDKHFEPTLNDEHTDYQWSIEPPKPLHPRLALAITKWVAQNAS